MNSLETAAILRHDEAGRRFFQEPRYMFWNPVRWSVGFSRRFAFVPETSIRDPVALLLLLSLMPDNRMCVNLTISHA